LDSADHSRGEGSRGRDPLITSADPLSLRCVDSNASHAAKRALDERQLSASVETGAQRRQQRTATFCVPSIAICCVRCASDGFSNRCSNWSQ